MAKTPEYGETGAFIMAVYHLAAGMLGVLILVHVLEIRAKTEFATISRTEDQRNNLRKVKQSYASIVTGGSVSPLLFG